MALYKRGTTWWVRFTHNGKEIRQSSGTDDKQAAQHYHDQLKASLWRQERLGEKPTYRWEDAVERWFTDRLDTPSAYNLRLAFRWLDQHLRGVMLTDIDRALIERIRKMKVKEGVMRNGVRVGDAKPRTVNAVLNVIRAVLRAAVEWEWIEKAPAVKLLPEESRRVRFLTADEEARLIEELPPHLKVIVQFGLATGLRMSNIIGLEWSQVDVRRSVAWIHPDQAKARKAIPVPLNTDAMALIRSQIGKHMTHVFVYNGKPIIRANQRAWRQAVARAGIRDFTFHCLRHTWASRLMQSGVPLHALMEMGGWTDVDMVRKYAHFGVEHLVEHAEKIAKFAQNSAHDKKEGHPKVA